jgi:hypothetical protein
LLLGLVAAAVLELVGTHLLPQVALLMQILVAAVAAAQVMVEQVERVVLAL